MFKNINWLNIVTIAVVSLIVVIFIAPRMKSLISMIPGLKNLTTAA